MSADAVHVHIDGAARGNPGPGAFAFIIRRSNEVITDKGCLGKTTNNVAEYTALVRALERAAQLGERRLLIHSDSELLVKQMNGEYRVKNPDLKMLYDEARGLLRQFDGVKIIHVARAQNAHADQLCNEALDGKAAVRAPKPASGGASSDTVRLDALDCLRSAAKAWAKGNPDDPPAEAVWEQLWSILEEQGVLKTRRPG